MWDSKIDIQWLSERSLPRTGVAVALHTFPFHLTARCIAPAFTVAPVWPVTTCSCLLCYYRPGSSHTGSSVFTRVRRESRPCNVRTGQKLLSTCFCTNEMRTNSTSVSACSLGPVCFYIFVDTPFFLSSNKGSHLRDTAWLCQVFFTVLCKNSCFSCVQCNSFKASCAVRIYVLQQCHVHAWKVVWLHRERKKMLHLEGHKFLSLGASLNGFISVDFYRKAP